MWSQGVKESSHAGYLFGGFHASLRACSSQQALYNSGISATDHTKHPCSHLLHSPDLVEEISSLKMQAEEYNRRGNLLLLILTMLMLYSSANEPANSNTNKCM